jgi:hypothetical protein
VVNELSNHVIEDAARAINLVRTNSPNFRYITSRLNGFNPDWYTDMEYDLSEHGRIIDTDSFVSSALRKKRQSICKEGVELISDVPRNLQYIQKRLEEFEYVSGQSFESLVEEITENMVNFNNCFILKYRKEENSTGLIRYSGETAIKPIAGIYILAAPTIDTATDKIGNIIKYRHRISSVYTKIFKASDILHMYQNKRTGITIGTPPLEAVKDDVYALRNIEQCAETMIYRNASPFIHVKVGEKDSPARTLADGSSEIDIYSSIIDNMHQFGGVATPHRVSIDLKGSESQALRLESYLRHYQNRVLAGLCTSEVDLAISNSTTGGSAGIISQPLKDEVRAYQKTISDFITNKLFCELLLESPYYKNKLTIPVKERVRLSFNENDISTRIKIESHYLNLFQGGLITKEFASLHIKNMVKKDIQPDPLVENKGSVSVIKKSSSGTVSNALNQESNSGGKKIQDSFTLEFNRDSDLDSINSFIQNKMLHNNYSYGIIDAIYDYNTQYQDSLSSEDIKELIFNDILDYLLIKEDNEFEDK